ncbi:MAG: helicase-associated domain-containing protein [Sporichthyaceae bacterium]
MSTLPAAPARTLADELRARDDDGLAALLATRPDLVSPVPTDMTNLVARATTRASVARALDCLDRFTLQVLDAVAHAPEVTTTARVHALVPAAPDEVTAALARLRERALIWGSEDSLRVVRTVREVLGPGPGGTGPPLVQAAAGYPTGRLQRLLRDLGLPTTPDAPSALEALRTHMTSPGTLTALLAQAPAAARALLVDLDARGGIGAVGRADREVDASTASTALEWLLAHGILIAIDAERAVLPAEIAVTLRGGALHPDPATTPPGLAVTSVDVDVVERTAAGSAMAFVRQMEDLLSDWALDPPGVLRTGGGLGVRELRRVQTTFDLDPAHAVLLVETAYIAGLLASDGGNPEHFAPTPEFDRWLAMNTARRWSVLAAAWLETSRVPHLVGRVVDTSDKPANALGRDLDRALAPEIRQGTLGELAALPPGSTTTAADLIARLGWWRPRRGAVLRADLVPQTFLEAELLGVCGRAALSSFGRALLKGDPDLAAVKLAATLPTPLEQVLIQADLTAVAPGPLIRSLAVELAMCADVESTGGATVYRFSDASIRRALDAGRAATDLHELFARASRTPVPQPLTYLIDDVARRHGRIRVGTAEAYLRCDDENVLAELVNDKRAVKLGLRRLAPTVVVATVGVDTLLARLRELGYAPAAESAAGAVVLRRPDSRRTPPRTAPRPVLADRPTPSPQLQAAAVRALRAGERATVVGARLSDPNATPRQITDRPGTTATLERLRTAAHAGSSVWLSYVGDDGTATDRIVDPIAVEGAVLRAFDHRQNRIRSFSVIRISAVADA